VGRASRKLTTIASTVDEFNFFGFGTSINNSGEVAFTAELDEEFGFDEGLFSGSGGKKSAVTTHYLTSISDFDGSDSRPSINNLGDIAFVESIEFDRGIFVGREGDFTPIVTSDHSVGVPTLNDAGTVAFTRSFTDETTQEFVEEIMTIDADGTLTEVADTTGAFAFFGFRPPSINNDGDVAFHATFDDGTSGIFMGSDQVIGTGDTLDGSTVQNLTFCEEGLSDSGQLAFVATLEDPNTPEGFRMRSSAPRRSRSEGATFLGDHKRSQRRRGAEVGTAKGRGSPTTFGPPSCPCSPECVEKLSEKERSGGSSLLEQV